MSICGIDIAYESSKRVISFYILKNFMITYVFNGVKKTISAIWTPSQNFPFNIFIVLILFVHHEMIGRWPKIKVLICTVQKLWLFMILPCMVIWPYIWPYKYEKKVKYAK